MQEVWGQLGYRDRKGYRVWLDYQAVQRVRLEQQARQHLHQLS